MIQTKDELEDWYEADDPWEYETSKEDEKRKHVLLSQLTGQFNRALDIGCGHGFVTRDLPAKEIVGTDLSEQAISQARKFTQSTQVTYQALDLFDHTPNDLGTFDLIVVTGVMYPQYIGKSNTLVYLIVDKLLEEGGTLVSVHINDWYTASFPYLKIESQLYSYREYTHYLEVYRK